MLPAAPRPYTKMTPVRNPRVLALSLALGCLSACKKESPSVSDMSREVKDKEDKRKREREEAQARDRAALDKLLPQLRQKRQPLEKTFEKIWANLPDPKSLKRKDCPDAKITADTPDASKRSMLVLHREAVHILTGRAEVPKDGGAETFHTVAAFHAFTMRRPEGKETPLLERLPPETSELAEAQLAAIDYVMSHRYFGIALFTAFKESSVSGAKPSPARLEGFTVVVDSQTGMPLCQIDAFGEGQVLADTVSTGSAADEEVWSTYIIITAKNLDAISKVLAVDGFERPKKK